MEKESLIKELINSTFIMLKPSSVGGVGVFAIRDIPKGCRNMFSEADPEEKWITIPRADVEALPEHARFLVENYCLFDEVNYFVPEKGFKKMDLSLFINHSEQPNIISVNEGEFFETIRDIKTGEELLIDYGEIVDNK
jgi:SET domain-containing protein